MASLTVYESEDNKRTRMEERGRFMGSVSRLEPHGIAIGVSTISSPSDLPPGSEASSLVDEKGLSVLPITVFDDVVVDSGSYPPDSVIVDYVDVPEGVLGAKRSSAPENKMEYCCMCGLH